MGEFDKYLNQRMMSKDGWVYFCRICGTYKTADNFYNRKKTNFGIDTRCKLHYTKREEGHDKSMDYIKFTALTQDDWRGAQRVLEILGYKFGENVESIHNQFIKKHNL